MSLTLQERAGGAAALQQVRLGDTLTYQLVVELGADSTRASGAGLRLCFAPPPELELLGVEGEPALALRRVGRIHAAEVTLAPGRPVTWLIRTRLRMRPHSGEILVRARLLAPLRESDGAPSHVHSIDAEVAFPLPSR